MTTSAWEAESDILEYASRRITQAAFIAALLVSVVTPLLAIGWSRQPFSGFLVEPTLVISGLSGSSWGSYSLGFKSGERIIRMAGVPVATSGAYAAVLANHKAGDRVSVFTEFPDGTRRVHPSVVLRQFPPSDMLTFFLLPYLVGLAYLGIGLWIYQVRGKTRPGRALTFFCLTMGVTTILFFDMATTHVLAAVWTISLAMLGGSLTSLTLRFPQEWGPVRRRRWLMAVPYGPSLLLAGWGVYSVTDAANPWQYVSAWAYSYRYAAAGCLLFLGVTLYRAFTSSSMTVRQQSRIVLLGGGLAFLPTAFFFLAPLFNLQIAFLTAWFLPELLLFPLAVGVAISRYRLLEMDVIVNRTLVYGSLTALLAGGVTAGTLLARSLFVTITGESSTTAVILTTLLVASAFTPLKARIQAFVDRQFKQTPDRAHSLRVFGDEVRSFLHMHDANQLTERLLEEAVQALQASSGAVSLFSEGRLQVVHTRGRWRGNAALALPIICAGERYGLLSLGPRLDEGFYSRPEVEALQQVAGRVACVLRLALALHQLSEAEDGLHSLPGRSGARRQAV